MLAVTWTIILGFTGRFFWKVLTNPEKSDTDAKAQTVDLEKDV
jgi:hypothetical protein